MKITFRLRWRWENYVKFRIANRIFSFVKLIKKYSSDTYIDRSLNIIAPHIHWVTSTIVCENVADVPTTSSRHRLQHIRLFRYAVSAMNFNLETQPRCCRWLPMLRKFDEKWAARFDLSDTKRIAIEHYPYFFNKFVFWIENVNKDFVD